MSIKNFALPQNCCYQGINISMRYFGYIDRSVHPVFALSIGYCNNFVTYLSSSVWESDFNIDMIKDGCVAVIVGSHGANLKEKFIYGAEFEIYAPTRSVEYTDGKFYEVPEDARIGLRLASSESIGK